MSCTDAAFQTSGLQYSDKRLRVKVSRPLSGRCPPCVDLSLHHIISVQDKIIKVLLLCTVSCQVLEAGKAWIQSYSSPQSFVCWLVASTTKALLYLHSTQNRVQLPNPVTNRKSKLGKTKYLIDTGRLVPRPSYVGSWEQGQTLGQNSSINCRLKS